MSTRTKRVADVLVAVCAAMREDPPDRRSMIRLSLIYGESIKVSSGEVELILDAGIGDLVKKWAQPVQKLYVPQ